eukprot:CAMPEP_0171501662 /NCGR_PEP_ID=MMETSP0958-20121227/9692_1 /TAXON_ID=87120 /ORGANISM="Aurantiochytrium limacinum, Strain ATCCMYA-1381" /LENGTH=304 /DNA_ID=CAMNT_0012036521 /DNA_START=251 /DNA_END=1165 /DNA_ORIENTATION=-
MAKIAEQPSVFIGHGGGPMFLLDTHGSGPFAAGDIHSTAVKEIKKLWDTLYGKNGDYEEPEAIIVVSAHWEAEAKGKKGKGDQFEVLYRKSAKEPLLFDYYGFPPESYKYTYNAPLDVDKRERVLEALLEGGVNARPSEDRTQFDHGVYIPLLLVRPQADVPVIQVSLGSSMSPASHIQLGKALGKLRSEGFLIIGSGMATHNMYTARATGDEFTTTTWAQNFQDWLDDNFANPERTPAEAEQAVLKWESKAPDARTAHPREEHLLPLFVNAASVNFRPGNKIFQRWMASSFALNIFVWPGQDS